MKISTAGYINTNDLSMEDLLAYLSQVVLSKTDDEIDTANDNLRQSKTQLFEAKSQLQTMKSRLSKVAIEFNRYSLMFEVLTKINALKREGVIVGSNKIKISNILEAIETQSISTLKSLEDRLSAYVPETPKITYS